MTDTTPKPTPKCSHWTAKGEYLYPCHNKAKLLTGGVWLCNKHRAAAPTGANP